MASNETPGGVPRDGVSPATPFDDLDAPEARERAAAIRRDRSREKAPAEGEDARAPYTGIASTIGSLDEVVESPTGEPSASTLDSSDIQRVIAERHGAQRARLGWAADEVRREYAILRDEIASAVRRRAPSFLYAPTMAARRNEAENSLALLKQFLAIAERLGVASHARVSAELSRRGE